MSFADLHAYLQAHFGTELSLTNPQNPQPYLTVPAEQLAQLCRFLRDDERLYFDLLACVTAIDNGVEASTMDVMYNLTSIPYEHNLGLRVVVPRDKPVVPSVAHIWRTADWHEREAYDLLGVSFTGHPDLRRILLPTDWVGHPLRTDYQEGEQYHGIRTQ